MTYGGGNELGFEIPTSEQITSGPLKENEMLIRKKQNVLTELAAIESGIDIFDFLDPARDQLQSSVTDVPCSVELIKLNRCNKIPALDVTFTGGLLADIIRKVASNPADYPLEAPHPTPRSIGIVNHAKVYFGQLARVKDTRAGLLTAFSIIPRTSRGETPSMTPEDSVMDEIPHKNRAHPFFPDVRGLRPLLGHMKQQLGSFPHFVRNPPSDAECEEMRLAAEPDCFRKHLFEICGSSSDDEFDPDAPLKEPTRYTQ